MRLADSTKNETSNVAFQVLGIGHVRDYLLQDFWLNEDIKNSSVYFGDIKNCSATSGAVWVEISTLFRVFEHIDDAAGKFSKSNE